MQKNSIFNIDSRKTYTYIYIMFILYIMHTYAWNFEICNSDRLSNHSQQGVLSLSEPRPEYEAVTVTTSMTEDEW